MCKDILQVKGVLKKEGKMASGRQLTGQWDKELLVRSEGSPDVSIWRRDATPSNVCRHGASSFDASICLQHAGSAAKRAVTVQLIPSDNLS